MNLTDPRFILDVLQSIALVVLWLRKPGQDAAAAVVTLRQYIDDQVHQLGARQTTIEERIQHMPTSEEMAQLEGTVKAINERTTGMAAGMDTVRTQLNRIENYLLNSKS